MLLQLARGSDLAGLAAPSSALSAQQDPCCAGRCCTYNAMTLKICQNYPSDLG